MIYIEKDSYYTSLFLVEKIDGNYFGLGGDEPGGWYATGFTILPNEDGFTQAFLAPSILDRWTK